jgi:hypothetical protein
MQIFKKNRNSLHQSICGEASRRLGRSAAIMMVVLERQQCFKRKQILLKFEGLKNKQI